MANNNNYSCGMRRRGVERNLDHQNQCERRKSLGRRREHTQKCTPKRKFTERCQDPTRDCTPRRRGIERNPEVPNNYTPPPPPPGSEESWELQFCKWWGWNWIRKENIEVIKFGPDAPNKCPCPCPCDCCSPIRSPVPLSPQQQYYTPPRRPERNANYIFRDLCNCIFSKNRQKTSESLQKLYSTPSNSVVCHEVYSNQDEGIESISCCGAQRNFSRSTSKGRQKCPERSRCKYEPMKCPCGEQMKCSCREQMKYSGREQMKCSCGTQINICKCKGPVKESTITSTSSQEECCICFCPSLKVTSIIKTQTKLTLFKASGKNCQCILAKAENNNCKADMLKPCDRETFKCQCCNPSNYNASGKNDRPSQTKNPELIAAQVQTTQTKKKQNRNREIKKCDFLHLVCHCCCHCCCCCDCKKSEFNGQPKTDTDSKEPESEVRPKHEPEQEVRSKFAPEKEVQSKSEPEQEVRSKSEPEQEVRSEQEVKWENDLELEIRSEREQEYDNRSEPLDNGKNTRPSKDGKDSLKIDSDSDSEDSQEKLDKRYLDSHLFLTKPNRVPTEQAFTIPSSYLLTDQAILNPQGSEPKGTAFKIYVCHKAEPFSLLPLSKQNIRCSGVKNNLECTKSVHSENRTNPHKQNCEEQCKNRVTTKVDCKRKDYPPNKQKISYCTENIDKLTPQDQIINKKLFSQHSKINKCQNIKYIEDSQEKTGNKTYTEKGQVPKCPLSQSTNEIKNSKGRNQRFTYRDKPELEERLYQNMKNTNNKKLYQNLLYQEGPTHRQHLSKCNPFYKSRSSKNNCTFNKFPEPKLNSNKKIASAFSTCFLDCPVCQSPLNQRKYIYHYLGDCKYAPYPKPASSNHNITHKPNFDAKYNFRNDILNKNLDRQRLFSKFGIPTQKHKWLQTTKSDVSDEFYRMKISEEFCAPDNSKPPQSLGLDNYKSFSLPDPIEVEKDMRYLENLERKVKEEIKPRNMYAVVCDSLFRKNNRSFESESTSNSDFLLKPPQTRDSYRVDREHSDISSLELNDEVECDSKDQQSLRFENQFLEKVEALVKRLITNKPTKYCSEKCDTITENTKYPKRTGSPIFKESAKKLKSLSHICQDSEESLHAQVNNFNNLFQKMDELTMKSRINVAKIQSVIKSLDQPDCNLNRNNTFEETMKKKILDNSKVSIFGKGDNTSEMLETLHEVVMDTSVDEKVVQSLFDIISNRNPCESKNISERQNKKNSPISGKREEHISEDWITVSSDSRTQNEVGHDGAISQLKINEIDDEKKAQDKNKKVSKRKYKSMIPIKKRK